MKKEDFCKLYEAQYHREIERRDKLDARLQLPFAIMVVLVGFLSYMLQNKNPTISSIGSAIFWLLFILSTIATGFAFYFFRLSWFGHTDKLLPTAQAIEDYKKQLLDYYKDDENPNEKMSEHLKETLFNYYVEFSSVNAINNDTRSYYIYRTTVSLTIAIILAFFSYIPYYAANLDKSFDKSPQKVEVTNIIKVENQPAMGK